MNFKFIDLKPHYDAIKMSQTLSESGRILHLISQHLIKLVKQEKRKNFRVFLDQGGSLDLLQLKQLSTYLKRDYTNKEMKDHV